MHSAHGSAGQHGEWSRAESVTSFGSVGFRETVLHSPPVHGNKKHNNTAPLSMAITGSEHPAGKSSLSRNTYRTSRMITSPNVGGRDHLGIEHAGLTAALDDRPSTAMTPPKMFSPGSRRLTRKTACVPADTKLFNGESVVYNCGVKEAEMRLAVSKEAIREADSLPSAGLVPSPRSRRSQKAIGGDDHFQSLWSGSASASYKEGLGNALQQVAFDPRALAETAKEDIAGVRVEPKWLGRSIRTARPAAGFGSLSLSWDDGSTPSERPSTPSRTVVRTTLAGPEFQVGGKSGKFLARPQTAGARFAHMSSGTGVASALKHDLPPGGSSPTSSSRKLPRSQQLGGSSAAAETIGIVTARH